jgi:hypothetical protein
MIHLLIDRSVSIESLASSLRCRLLLERADLVSPLIEFADGKILEA